MLNEKYLEKIKKILSEDDFEKYINTFKDNPKRAFHVNTKKSAGFNPQKLTVFGGTSVPYAENSFYFDYPHIGNHPYHHAGIIYIQEPAAMFPVSAVDISPDWKILDLCAAPGGKSSQLMQRLGEKGRLVSNEFVPSRCKTLTGNFERLGYKNTTVTCASADQIAEAYPSYFDLTVVDAPCSGEGMFRKEPAAVADWSEETVKMCAERQHDILEQAAKTVKGGGYLLYSTCTFSPEENELQIERFLSEHPEFEPADLKSTVYNYTASGIDINTNSVYRETCMRRFYPFISEGEGQFAALLRNTNEYKAVNFSQNPYKKPTKDELKIILEFLNKNLAKFETENIFINKDKVIYIDPETYIPQKIVYMCGITIGTIQKNYIKPHHQLFSAMGDYFIRKADFPADSKEIDCYLHGGSFEYDAENGLTAVCVDGVAVGGSKVVDGYLKNNYPRGLIIKK